MVPAISLADGKIITTSEEGNFSLFWLGENGWTEKVTESRETLESLSSFGQQLVTVRNSGTSG